MSAFELDTILTISSCINRVLDKYYAEDPRLRAIQGRSCVYRAALTRALLTRQGITNTFWTGDVRWAADTYPDGRNRPPKTRYLDCFERDAQQGDLGGHVCNLVQLRGGTCWLLDITMDQFRRDAERRGGQLLPAIEPPSVLLALTTSKQFDSIKKTGWQLSKHIPNTNTWCDYRYDTLLGFRRLRKLQEQGHETGLDPERWLDIYNAILTLFDYRLQSLPVSPSLSMDKAIPASRDHE